MQLKKIANLKVINNFHIVLEVLDYITLKIHIFLMFLFEHFYYLLETSNKVVRNLSSLIQVWSLPLWAGCNISRTTTNIHLIYYSFLFLFSLFCTQEVFLYCSYIFMKCSVCKSIYLESLFKVPLSQGPFNYTQW